MDRRLPWTACSTRCLIPKLVKSASKCTWREMAWRISSRKKPFFLSRDCDFYEMLILLQQYSHIAWNTDDPVFVPFGISYHNRALFYIQVWKQYGYCLRSPEPCSKYQPEKDRIFFWDPHGFRGWPCRTIGIYFSKQGLNLILWQDVYYGMSWAFDFIQRDIRWFPKAVSE